MSDFIFYWIVSYYCVSWTIDTRSVFKLRDWSAGGSHEFSELEAKIELEDFTLLE